MDFVEQIETEIKRILDLFPLVNSTTEEYAQMVLNLESLTESLKNLKAIGFE